MKAKVKKDEIGASDAKAHFSRLLEEVRRGRSFTITRRGRKLAELRPSPKDDLRPVFGCDRGRIVVGADFEEPIPGMDEYAG